VVSILLPYNYGNLANRRLGMITKEAATKAYETGVRKALVDAGLVKQARMPWEEDPGSALWPMLGTAVPLPMTGPLAALAAAPEGKGNRAFWGSAAGSLGGDILGSGVGASIGALLKNPGAAEALAKALSRIGAVGGSGLGYSTAVG
jgi:hypothetical protein